ncbi:thiopeptide-type bacteriocin biosynthesis protein [Actinoallomurus soli]|uniref:thiopeptide-type bacteriocin biosynthesis protein n=1 Tax=Actinoallomurus soli TaxID=2952535 RepID=UPI002093DAE4|nr:thiopeptide-type bacteriocin biosynthesis protein [Actinoallomurus soli]MCO5973355.1 thiopeptide-type bacteriocin biosynthesis protein [Actinoallomurus soli]
MNIPTTDTLWRQVTLWCDDWPTAEQIAVSRLGPQLVAAEHAQVITSWWFLRKGVSWRIRYLPAPGRQTQAVALLEQLMRELTATGAIRRWTTPIYEPETHAFGGPDGIDLAHQLFHADSRHVLDYIRHARLDHRRELGLLLGTALMRGAGLDWYEQGDVWAQVTAHRSSDQPVPSEAAERSVQQLITAVGHSADIPSWLSPPGPTCSPTPAGASPTSPPTGASPGVCGPYSPTTSCSPGTGWACRAMCKVSSQVRQPMPSSTRTWSLPAPEVHRLPPHLRLR